MRLSVVILHVVLVDLVGVYVCPDAFTHKQQSSLVIWVTAFVLIHYKIPLEMRPVQLSVSLGSLTSSLWHYPAYSAARSKSSDGLAHHY